MVAESKNKEEKLKTVKSWLKDKENLYFVLILIFAFIIRLYYFFLTKNQALWWDEADYLAYAKNLAGFGVEWIVTTKHNSIVSYIAAVIFKLGLGEASAKFFLQFIPSVLTVVLVYFICKEMYKDKRIGIIAALLIAVIWDYSFNSTRFHVDVPALFTGLLAIYVFWKGYENKEKIFNKLDSKWAIPITAFLVALTYMIRRGHFLFGVFIIAYMLLMYNWKDLIKDRYNWIGLFIGLTMLFIAESVIFNSKIGGVAGDYFQEQFKINFLPLKIFSSFFSLGTFMSSAFYYLFLVGIVVAVGKLGLSFGQWRKNRADRADVFNLIMIITTLAFFIFVLRMQGTFGEARWYYPLLFPSIIFVARGELAIFELVKLYSKKAAIILVLILMVTGGYYQMSAGDQAIRGRLHSFEGIRDASLLIKDISDKEDKILTLGQPQVEFYSERSTLHARDWVGGDATQLEHFGRTLEALKNNTNVKYILISFSEPNYPAWMQKVTANPSTGQVISWEIPFTLSKIYFTTGEQKILPEVNYGDIKFKLVTIKKEVFVYEIIKN